MQQNMLFVVLGLEVAEMQGSVWACWFHAAAIKVFDCRNPRNDLHSSKFERKYKKMNTYRLPNYLKVLVMRKNK
jgi:hypothetical protein